MSGGLDKSVDGLAAARVYTILSVAEVEDQGARQRLVKIRNPWSREKYTGAWSDVDTRWTAEAKKQVGGLTGKDDGTFFMPLETFKRVFGTFAVALYEDNWRVSRMDVHMESKTHTI